MKNNSNDTPLRASRDAAQFREILNNLNNCWSLLDYK